MHRYVRQPNYLGEMMIYASFAMMVGHWLPWVWLAIIWASLFATNMVMKEASMSRYPGWAAYRKRTWRSEEHTSELQSLMRSSYAVFCLKKKKQHEQQRKQYHTPTVKQHKHTHKTHTI